MCQGMVLRKTNSQINQVSKDEIQGLLRPPISGMDPRSAISSSSSLLRLESYESSRTDSQESLAIEVLQPKTAQKAIMAPQMQEPGALPLALAHKQMLPKTEKPSCALPRQVLPESQPIAKEAPDATPTGEKVQPAVTRRNPADVLKDLKQKLDEQKLEKQEPQKTKPKKKEPAKKENKTKENGKKKKSKEAGSEKKKKRYEVRYRLFKRTSVKKKKEKPSGTRSCRKTTCC